MASSRRWRGVVCAIVPPARKPRVDRARGDVPSSGHAIADSRSTRRASCAASATVRAVDGIDLEVARGTIFAVLGPNGAGKTTLMRMLATLLRPDAGRGDGDGARPRRRAGQGAGGDRDDRAVRLARRGSDRAREPGAGGAALGLRLARGAGAGRRAARGVRARRRGGAAGQGLFRRHAAAARHRRVAGGDAGRPVPRRADHRARPGGAAGGLADDPRGWRRRA